MDKLGRSSRIAIITKILMDNPNKIIKLNEFSDMLNAAKSTISEDILIIRESLSELEMGRIETISGVLGGIRFIPMLSRAKAKEFALDLCELLRDKNRVITGDFMYMTDIIYNPLIIKKAGLILASSFKEKKIDYVITVETKGIPLAYEVARNLGVQLVIARRENQVTEGSTVTINYVSATSGQLQQMSLSKKAMNPNCNSIFIDDFMKGGGTALGIEELVKEFNCTLVGIGVMVDKVDINKKLIDEYVSIVEIMSVDKTSSIDVQPYKKIF
ncbi:MAG: pur operon repressor [Clostridium sp.]|nr:pur operon repressor [Clostridium sp.]